MKFWNYGATAVWTQTGVWISIGFITTNVKCNLRMKTKSLHRNKPQNWITSSGFRSTTDAPGHSSGITCTKVQLCNLANSNLKLITQQGVRVEGGVYLAPWARPWRVGIVRISQCITSHTKHTWNSSFCDHCHPDDSVKCGGHEHSTRNFQFLSKFLKLINNACLINQSCGPIWVTWMALDTL